MHDKYAYEAFEMSLHDGDVERIRATGIAGLSIVADSLAAIRDTKVRVIRDERGLAVDFEREGEYVPFGNNDDRTDSIAVEITEKFMEYLRQHETYRHAKPTQSILTITSKRGVWKEDRYDTGWPYRWNSFRSGREPYERS